MKGCVDKPNVFVQCVTFVRLSISSASNLVVGTLEVANR